jgi:hypothetical protein
MFANIKDLKFEWDFLNDKNNLLIVFFIAHILDISSTASAISYYGKEIELNFVIRSMLGTALVPFLELGLMLGYTFIVKSSFDKHFITRLLLWFSVAFTIGYGVIPNIIKLFFIPI